MHNLNKNGEEDYFPSLGLHLRIHGLSFLQSRYDDSKGDCSLAGEMIGLQKQACGRRTCAGNTTLVVKAVPVYRLQFEQWQHVTL